jgi:pyruvate carboxylase subunit B
VKYLVTIGMRTVEVDLQGGRARVDGREVAAELVALAGGVERQLVLPDGIHTFAMIRIPGGWELVRAGELLRAEVVDERTRALETLTGRGHGAGGLHSVRAPMPGLVLRVETEAGATVRAGQGLVVLEAMKMENELSSPVAGTVTAIRAVPGQPVEKGTVLIEVTGEG